MTREEAIIYLKRADVTVGREPKTKTAEALGMAIKALEQEPCEDTISRQAAIDAAIEAADDWDGGCSKERERFIRDALEELPSAQPEQRWIPFKTRPLTKEEKEEHPEWDGILDCKLPDDG